MKFPSPRVAALTAAAAVAVVVAVPVWLYFAADRSPRFAECGGAAVAGGGDVIGGPFTLTDQTGARVTEAEVIDRPAILYFGYTWCPDICPVDTAKIADATAILEERGIEVKPVFVTIDPARDTPETLADYVGAMHPRMVGLTGTEAEIAAAAKAYRVYYKKQGDDPQDYLMDHSTLAYLMAPGEGFLDILRREMTADEVADKVACYVERV